MISFSLSKKFEELKGRRICLHGVYDHSQEILLGPRTAPGLINKKAQGMATNPMGFFVITPLYLKNGLVAVFFFLDEISRERVFVNRGWMPKNCSEWSHPQNTQLCVGVVQDWEKVTHPSSSDNYVH